MVKIIYFSEEGHKARVDNSKKMIANMLKYNSKNSHAPHRKEFHGKPRVGITTPIILPAIIIQRLLQIITRRTTLKVIILLLLIIRGLY